MSFSTPAIDVDYELTLADLRENSRAVSGASQLVTLGGGAYAALLGSGKLVGGEDLADQLTGVFLVVAGVFLATVLHWSTALAYRKLGPAGRRFTFRVSEAGIEMLNGGTEHRLPWTSIEKLRWAEGALVFDAPGRVVAVVPRRVISAEAERFLRELAPKNVEAADVRRSKRNRTLVLWLALVVLFGVVWHLAAR